MFGFSANRDTGAAQRRKLGRWGEKRCEKFLKKKGLKKLTSNFSCKFGEIDLVMVDKDGTIVFIEVKTRSDEQFAAVEEVVTPAKKRKLSRTARYFMAAKRIEDRPCRFDIVTIISSPQAPEQIRHYENTFFA